MKKTLLFILLSLSIPLFLNAQEYLSGLQENAWLRAEAASRKAKTPKSTQEIQAALGLPFLDDFSNPGPYPKTKLWLDNHVLVNNTYPKFPVTQGVATFDALSDSGSLYPLASAFPFLADFLTSQFIDLTSFTPADSLYMSFYYQPQGYGNFPNSRDSLVLEFMDTYHSSFTIDTTVTPHDTTFYDTWEHVWSASGMPLDTFVNANNLRWNRQVMIPVKDPKWFKNNFRFRFFNYASLASANIPSWRSNCDQWNLDMVYLDAARSINDTLFSDMTFVLSAPSFLKNYNAMPYEQFVADPNKEMRDSVEMLISNIGDEILNCYYRFNVKDASGAVVRAYDGGNYPLNPFATAGYQTHNPHRWPDFANWNFPISGTDSTSFTITHTIERLGASQEFNKENDTVRFTQNFFNYYAYDDGTAEAGYGLSPKGAMLAYRFQLNTPDTLRGAQMFFNRVIDRANQRNFDLTVWADNAGKPGKVIYKNAKLYKPLYTDSLNHFANYLFDADAPIVLDANNLTFYIGWVQLSDDNLNVGWDANSDASDNIFFSIDGSWQKTEYTGALMIRPMLGGEIPGGGKTIKTDGARLWITPNPGNGIFRLELPEVPSEPAGISREFELSVFTITGSRINTFPWRSQYDLSYLPKGIYILRLNTTDGYLNFQGKLVISK